VIKDPLRNAEFDLPGGVAKKDDAATELLTFRQLQLCGGAVRIEALSCAKDGRVNHQPVLVDRRRDRCCQTRGHLSS
jgi:hypothetical protein